MAGLYCAPVLDDNRGPPAGADVAGSCCYVAAALDDAAPNASECVEVDPAIEPVEISCLILHEMEQHAREAFPEECCGLLSGGDAVRFHRLHKCRNEMTALHDAAPERYPNDGRSGFHIHPLEYARIEQEVHAFGERITAVYHSHVGTRAYFSAVDLAFASRPDFPFPRADHIVIAVVDGRVQKDQRALFRRDRPGDGFYGRLLRELPA